MQKRLLPLVLAVWLPAIPAQAQFNVPNPAPAESFVVELGLMFWAPTPTVQVQTGALAAVGAADVDFIEEFGIDTKRFTEFRGVLKAGRRHKFRISRLPISYSETVVLQHTITFGDRTFPVTVPATAGFEWSLWRYGYEFDFVAGDRGLLGLITEVRVNDLMAGIEAAGFGAAQTDVTVPWPTMGVIARVYPAGSFSLTAEYTGLGLFNFIVDRVVDSIGEDFEGSTRDLDLYATLNFGRHVGVQGGYRWITADYRGDQESADLAMKRVYVGALVRF